MNIKVLGQVKHISEVKETKGQVKHQFVSLWIKTLEDSFISVNAWDDHMAKIKGLKVGDITTLECRLESHRNKKNPELFFHKIMIS